MQEKCEHHTSTSTSRNTSRATSPVAPQNGKNIEGSLFVGIEDAARASRQKELRSIRLSQLGDEIGDKQPDIQIVKKKLRWHALVDSGMGRLGFKTDIVNDEKRDGTWKATDAPPPVKGIDVSDSSSECCGVRDTVSIIKDLYDAEVHEGSPIEFYGMCTHMAEASSTSTYTSEQMERFRKLVQRVRAAGISPQIILQLF